MSKLWVNVTSSYTWCGGVTGIIRTEIEVTKYLLTNKDKSELDIQLFQLKDGRFISVQECEYLKKIAGSAQEESINSNNRESSVRTDLPEYLNVVTRLDAVKLLVQATYSLLPSNFRFIYRKVLYFLKSHLGRGLISKKHTSKSDKPVEEVVALPSIFSNGDVLLSLGLDWDSRIYTYFWDLKTKLNMKIFSICYDIIPILFPQWCASSTAHKFGDYILDVAMSAEHVFCISKTTMLDLKKFLERTGCTVPNLSQITLGTAIQNTGSTSCNSLPEDNGFILYVSTIEARKNHDILYKAYHRLASKFPNIKLPRLVFVGMTGWWVNDLLHQVSKDPLVKDLIMVRRRVSDKELASLYKNCLFVLFPSNYEGYGLGVVEALSYGKACLISNQGSLSEFNERFVIYADPWDVNQWCEGIIKLLDTNYRSSVEKNIKEGFTVTKWSESGSKILREINKYARQQ